MPPRPRFGPLLALLCATSPGALLAQAAPPAPPSAGAPAPAEVPPAAAASTVVTTPAPPPPQRLNTTGRDISLVAPLSGGNEVLGDLSFSITPDDTIFVNGLELSELVRPLLDPTRAEPVLSALRAQPRLNINDARALGLVLSYDPANVALQLEVPVELRARRAINLAGEDRELTGTFLEPARVSAYLNARGSTSYAYSGTNSGFADLSVLLDGAIRTRGVVFETEANYRSGGDQALTREGSRFIYDDRQRLIRYSLGDLRPVSRGFGGGTDLAGAGMFRTFSTLDPRRNARPESQRSFTILRPSFVEATVNGRLVQRLRLDPGSYDITDFPLVSGTNDIAFRITDDFGITETVSFSLFFDRSLLLPGTSEFGLYAGFRSPLRGGSRDYSFEQPAVTGFYRRGIDEYMTLGANFQAEENGGLVGGEILLARPFGTFGADVAVSQRNGLGSGYAINASFQRDFPRATGSRSASVFFETRSRNFGPPSLLESINPYKYEYGVTYAQSVGQTQAVSLSLRQSAGRDGEFDLTDIRANYSIQINFVTNLQLEAFYEDRLGRTNEGLRLTLTRRLGERSNLSFDADTSSETARLGYSTSRGRGLGSWSADASVEYGQDRTGLNASFSRQENRFQWSASHTGSFNAGDAGGDDQRTAFLVSSAIVYADGAFALSQPVSDGFALVTPHPTIRNATIYLEPDDEYFENKSGLFGGAVSPNLAAFSPRTLAFDAPDAPAGYDLGTGSARVFPPYRAGYRVVVGSDYSMTAVGRLLDENGEPVALLAGRAVELKENGAIATLFTNRTGQFGASGLAPGRWRIEMPGDPPLTYVITIPDLVGATVRLGDLTPSESNP